MFRNKIVGWIILGIGLVGLFGILGFVVIKHRVTHAVVSTTLQHDRIIIRRIYAAEVGVRETTGRNDGPRVQQYLQVVGLKGNYSYCAAFISWTFAQAGMAEPRTAWSPALFPKNRVIWERNTGGGKTVRNTQEITPQTGDVFSLYFQEVGRIGHCGFVDEWSGRWCMTVEANTNDVGSVATTDNVGNPIRAGPGEGVYRKKRSVSTLYKVADWVEKSNLSTNK
ncbi:CHAP domain-containing protein [bacterium A37T11]|nr:CHAP domain-containing protein [bacterium A37T11]